MRGRTPFPGTSRLAFGVPAETTPIVRLLVRLQPSQRRSSADGLRAVTAPQFPKEISHVKFDGDLCNIERIGDAFVRHAAGDQLQYLRLAAR